MACRVGILQSFAFPNADNAQLPPLLKAYPVAATKEYERYGYTLALYTFRFSFAPADSNRDHPR